MSDNESTRIHWSFWAIAVAGLVFNALGCLNYITQTNPEAVASMPDAYRMMIESRPAWGTAVFALAVFGGAIGCILLLLKRAPAFYMLIVALIAAIAAQIPFIGMEGLPSGVWIGGGVQILIAGLLAWYARTSAARGWVS